MRVYYIGILKAENKSQGEAADELAVASDYTSINYFQRTMKSEFMIESAQHTAKRTKPEQRLEVLNDQGMFKTHTYCRREGIRAALVTDMEYPKMVAQAILGQICDEFLSRYPRSAWAPSTVTSLPYAELKTYLAKYQNPEEADTIMKIQKELDETKVTVLDTVEKLLERGEKMSELVAKSNNLSTSSKAFYTQAKKQNSCCVLM